MVGGIPASLSFEQATVLPLTLSTAATGLLQQDRLGLAMPGADPGDRSGTALVWGGSTGIGGNAMQLARNARYRVVATASPHNFDYVRSPGAAEAVSHRSPTAVDEIVDRVGGDPLAGSLAIGSGSLRKVVAIAARTTGSKRVASAQPALLARLPSLRAPRPGVRVSAVRGGTLKDNEVGPAIHTGFLPTALATGAYRAAPDATVVGHGPARIPDALQQLRGGVFAKKVVVTV